MQIKNSHPFLSTHKDIAEIATPLIQLGISYFTYTKSFFNGERIYLTSFFNSLRNYIDKKHYLVGNVEASPVKYKNQIVLWDTLPRQYIYDDNVRSRGIDHGIFMIVPVEDGCEYYGFATKKGNDRIINTYLTNLDYLKKFTHIFKEQASTILKLANNNRFILPFHEYDLSFLESPSISENKSKSPLSKRQLQCMLLLMKGYTMREIGLKLQLSPRTIETYINNLKIKLRSKTRAELILKVKDLL